MHQLTSEIEQTSALVLVYVVAVAQVRQVQLVFQWDFSRSLFNRNNNIDIEKRSKQLRVSDKSRSHSDVLCHWMLPLAKQ